MIYPIYLHATLSSALHICATCLWTSIMSLWLHIKSVYIWLKIMIQEILLFIYNLKDFFGERYENTYFIMKFFLAHCIFIKCKFQQTSYCDMYIETILYTSLQQTWWSENIYLVFLVDYNKLSCKKLVSITASHTNLGMN